MSFLVGSYQAGHADPAFIWQALGLRNGDLQTHHTGELKIWAGKPRPTGMGGILVEMADGILCGYGDRLGWTEEIPQSGGAVRALQWFRGSFGRFSGAFCSPNRLVLWTDEMAAGPLFYAFHDSGAPVFASEAKLLLALQPEKGKMVIPPKPRPLPEPGATLFEGVYAVQPGRMVTLARDEHRWEIQGQQTYFSLPNQPQLTDLDQASRSVVEALDRAVAESVHDLSEVSVTLSGGVDSSSVAALARRHVQTVHSFTVGTPFGNEFTQARQAAGLLGLDHQELWMEPADLAGLLPRLIWAMETWDPLTLQIAAPVAFLYEKLAGSNSIFLTGYGADLIFAGVVDRSLPEPDLEQSILHQVQLTVPTNELTPAFATRCEVTVRYPYWRPELLCLGLNIRARLKVRQNEVKYVLRHGLQDILPHAIAWRPKTGIHEGTAMQRMFSEALNAGTPAGQNARLRQMAAEIFADLADLQLPGERKEELQCASF